MCDLKQQIINEHLQSKSERENKAHHRRWENENREKCEVEEWLEKVVMKRFDEIGINMLECSEEEYELIKQKEEIEYKLWKIRNGK